MQKEPTLVEQLVSVLNSSKCEHFAEDMRRLLRYPITMTNTYWIYEKECIRYRVMFKVGKRGIKIENPEDIS